MQTTPRTRTVIPFLNSDENRGQCRQDDKTQPFVCRMGGAGPVCFRESPATPVCHYFRSGSRQGFSAAVEAPDIHSHGARVNAVFYLASGAGPPPVVLLLHGFPGNEQNMDL